MISGRRKPKAYEQHVASILRELPMSFETPESALAALQEKIAHIDPARSYETSHGRVSGAELRAQLEKCAEWNGVKLPAREVTR
jgi:hypothetical protein